MFSWCIVVPKRNFSQRTSPGIAKGPGKQPERLIWRNVRLPMHFSRFARYGPHRETTYLSTCAPNEDSNQAAFPIRIFIVRAKTICILVHQKYAKVRFWSDCANPQADLIHRWAHMSEGTFSDVATNNVCWRHKPQKQRPEESYVID